MRKLIAGILVVLGTSSVLMATPNTSVCGSTVGPTLAACKVPEIDPSTGIAAIALLVGSFMVIRGRRKA